MLTCAALSASFISTLLTAVLTHHLHWVQTVGAAGRLRPLPPARTLVVGRRTELVNRLLLVLSYFIRDQLVSRVDSLISTGHTGQYRSQPGQYRGQYRSQRSVQVTARSVQVTVASTGHSV